MEMGAGLLAARPLLRAACYRATLSALKSCKSVPQKPKPLTTSCSLHILYVQFCARYELFCALFATKLGTALQLAAYLKTANLWRLVYDT
jgi:hypothetical protein